MKDIRLGKHSGELQYEFMKVTPDSASRSMFGVCCTHPRQWPRGSGVGGVGAVGLGL